MSFPLQRFLTALHFVCEFSGAFHSFQQGVIHGYAPFSFFPSPSRCQSYLGQQRNNADPNLVPDNAANDVSACGDGPRTDR
jgi:hypothetical protein